MAVTGYPHGDSRPVGSCPLRGPHHSPRMTVTSHSQSWMSSEPQLPRSETGHQSTEPCGWQSPPSDPRLHRALPLTQPRGLISIQESLQEEAWIPLPQLSASGQAQPQSQGEEVFRGHPEHLRWVLPWFPPSEPSAAPSRHWVLLGHRVDSSTYLLE